MDRIRWDIQYMQQALLLAQKAGEAREVPIGAVVIDPYGTVLGEGYNRVESLHSQAEHAEIAAIRAAGERVQNWRLNGCALYVTLEPCMMCVSLIALSRIERIVYGAESPRFGFSLDTEGVLGLYSRQIKNITSGVCREEAVALLERYFVHMRE